jgi:outer membrane protein assembly factor BamD
MFDKITFGNGDNETSEQEAAATLVATGMEAFNEGDYYNALTAFNQILERYPFSPEAMLAKLKSADSHFYRGEYLEAKALYQEFGERHPTNEAVPYVMFQIGRCDFRRVDRIDRDVSGARDSIKSFSRLLRTFPDSPYRREAKAHIENAKMFLVNHEYSVAAFYVRTEQYEQAKHRLRYLINAYPDSATTNKAKELLGQLEAGNPPKWGIRKWLPSLAMPDLNFWSDKEEELPVPPVDEPEYRQEHNIIDL